MDNAHELVAVVVLVVLAAALVYLIRSIEALRVELGPVERLAHAVGG